MYDVLCVDAFNLQKWYSSRIAFESSSFGGMSVCSPYIIVPLCCPLFCSVLPLVMDPGAPSSAQCHLQRRPCWKALWDVYPKQDCSVLKHTWSQLSRFFDENGYAALCKRFWPLVALLTIDITDFSNFYHSEGSCVIFHHLSLLEFVFLWLPVSLKI